MRIALVFLTVLALEGCGWRARGLFAEPGVRTASAAVPVRISSLETNFATKGLLIGTARVYPESVVVTFDSSYIYQSALQSGGSSYHLDSMTVGLGAGSADGRWRISAKSAALIIPDSLAERVAFSLGTVRFSVPRVPGDSLSRSWLVVTFHQIVGPALVPRAQQRGGTSYAHSSRSIFAGLSGG